MLHHIRLQMNGIKVSYYHQKIKTNSYTTTIKDYQTTTNQLDENTWRNNKFLKIVYHKKVFNVMWSIIFNTSNINCTLYYIYTMLTLGVFMYNKLNIT